MGYVHRQAVPEQAIGYLVPQYAEQLPVYCGTKYPADRASRAALMWLVRIADLSARQPA